MTLIAAAIAVGLALPGTGLAADSQAPAPGSIQGVVGPAVQQASQTVKQASQTVQDAAAASSAAQASPVNVAVQIVISSPGASPVIVQTNANSSAAKASNASATKQDSPASQPASGGGSGGGSVQGVRQTSGTQQGAAAGAKAVQTNPVNVAIQIVKDSPGASPVIVQLNGNQADSQAANSSTTDQGANAVQAGSGGGPGTGSRLPAQSADRGPSPLPAELALPPPASPGDLGIDLEALGGLPDLTRLWEAVAVDLPKSSWLPGFEVSFLGWPFADSADDEQAGGRGDRRGKTAGAAPHDRAFQPEAGRDGGAFADLFAGAPTGLEIPASLSSSFVQTPAKTRKDSNESAPRVPVPALPAPAGGGGGSASAGLLPVALATLIFWLTSLGLLLGRLRLASARWRHQFYLAPLQRPG